MKADFNDDDFELTIKTEESFPVLTHDLPVSADFFGSTGSKQFPGPFSVKFKGEITVIIYLVNLFGNKIMSFKGST
jgi:hypothetical protein